MMEAKTIVKMKFGSHLYGLNRPESDTDIKGIFIPEYKDIILGKAPKTSINVSTNKDNNSKNSQEDIDTEMFTLMGFIKMCEQGQTSAVDMLFAPKEMIIESSPEWDYIQKNKKKLLTGKASSFIGYCYQQANKYGIKGSRIKAMKQVVDYLNTQDQSKRLKDIKLVSMIKEIQNDHVKEIEHTSSSGVLAPYLEVCGRKFGMMDKISHVVEVISTIEGRYGERARLAEKNEGVDWKALSHALRVCYEAQELLSTGKVTFPFTGAKRYILMEIKTGRADYSKVAEIIEENMQKVKELESKTKLPDKIDGKFWQEFIYKCYSRTDI